MTPQYHQVIQQRDSATQVVRADLDNLTQELLVSQQITDLTVQLISTQAEYQHPLLQCVLRLDRHTLYSAHQRSQRRATPRRCKRGTTPMPIPQSTPFAESVFSGEATFLQHSHHFVLHSPNSRIHRTLSGGRIHRTLSEGRHHAQEIGGRLVLTGRIP